MVRSWAWLAVCLGLASTASAESAIPQNRLTAPSEIPSGGVLPIFGSCYDAACSVLRSAIVTHASSGERVEGVIEIVPSSSSYEALAYFTPSVPFASGGSYRVSLPGYSTPASGASFTVRDAASAGLDASALEIATSLAKEQLDSKRECCASSPSSCFAVEWTNSASMLILLSARAPVATQYLFELSVRAQEDTTGEVIAAFRPLPPDQANLSFFRSFDGAARSYCTSLRARPIAGGEPFEVASQCVANELTGLGKEARAPEEVAKERAECTRSHADAAVSSAGLVDAAVDGDGEELGRGADRKIEPDSGCQLGGGGLQGWWLLALAAFTRRRRGA